MNFKYFIVALILIGIMVISEPVSLAGMFSLKMKPTN